MEKELGFKLFARSKRKAELTAAGQNLYEHIVKLIDGHEIAVSSSRHLASGASGSIVVATTSYIECLVLINRISYFRK